MIKNMRNKKLRIIRLTQNNNNNNNKSNNKIYKR